MTPDKTNRRQIKSVGRTCEIIEYLHQNGAMTVGELAEKIDLTPGTIHTHLMTLCHYGLIEKKAERYQLGLPFISLGDRVRNRVELYQAGQAETDNLAEKTGEVAHLIVENEGLEVILYEAFGEQAAGQELYIKNRGRLKRHLHYSAAGKAILAFFPDKRVESILDTHGLVERTANTITDSAALYNEIDKIRDQGFAINDEEGVHGIRAVGVPIHDIHEDVIGAISLSGPASRFQKKTLAQEMSTVVKQSANLIEVELQTSQFNA